MLGIGWTEMLVIGVVALIVIGPKDLPVVMRRVGQFAGQIRRMGSEFQRELNKATGLNEVKNLRDSITAPLKQTAAEIRKEFNTVTAAGTQPSGAIKPADPKAESVVDEIHAAAGMTPPPKADEAAKPVAAEPVKAKKPAAKRVAKAAPVPDSVVETAPLPAVEPARPAARKAPAKKAAAAKEPSPAPIEAAAPAKRASRVRKTPEAVPPTPEPKTPPVNDVETVTTPAKRPVTPRRKPQTKAEKTE